MTGEFGIMLIPILRTILGVAAAFVITFGANAAQPFDTRAFQEAQAAGKTIFIDVTASWCPTCRQ